MRDQYDAIVIGAGLGGINFGECRNIIPIRITALSKDRLPGVFTSISNPADMNFMEADALKRPNWCNAIWEIKTPIIPSRP